MFTLTGTLQNHAGVPHAGVKLLLIPSPSTTLSTTGKVVHVDGDEVVTDAAGSFTKDLLAHEGLTYTVRSTSGGVLGPVRFAAPDDGTTIDLRDVTPILAPSPMAEYVRGQDGATATPTADVIVFETGA